MDARCKQFNETIEKWITYLNDYTLDMLRQNLKINHGH